MPRRPRTRPGDLGWSDDYISEHAYLVERGVRPMAIVGHVEANGLMMLAAASRLERASAGVPIVPFVIPRLDGFADCGFAASAWIVDLYEWLHARLMSTLSVTRCVR